MLRSNTASQPARSLTDKFERHAKLLDAVFVIFCCWQNISLVAPKPVFVATQLLAVACTFNRSAAETNCRQWPELMLLLENNQISLTTINLVGPKLTAANKELILNEIIGKSTREVRQLLAEVDASGQRRRQAALIDLKLALTAEVLERWEDAKALVCGGGAIQLRAHFCHQPLLGIIKGTAVGQIDCKKAS